MNENPQSRIRVGIVEDTANIREAVTVFINHTPDFELVGVCSNAEDAINEFPLVCPDVVLMDIGLPGMNGIECVRKLKVSCTNTQFLICTVFEDDNNILEALKAGATGYILKNSSPQAILNAIRELYQGGSPMSGSIARRVISQFQKTKQPDESALLTSRENEILQLLAEGYRYKEIGDKLHISFTTVRTHIHNIYEKLQVQSRTEAINKTRGGSSFQFLKFYL